MRLCLAAGCTPNAIDAIFDWIWREGRAVDSVDKLATLAMRLGIADPAAALSSAEVKSALRAHGEAALDAGVFGVPTAVVAGELFWGLDATPMLEAFLADPALFRGGEYARLDGLPVAAARG